MIKRNLLSLVILLTSVIVLPSISWADSEGKDQLRIQTGTPKRTNETIFSSLVAWRKEQANVNKANGLTFIHGSGDKKPTTDVEAARKIASALNGGVNYSAPRDRGAIVKSSKDKAEILISNKEGFDLIRLTTRDYTNQKLQYNIPGKTFNDASVDLAIDLVYSAAVEYLDNFASDIKLKTTGGTITVTKNNDKPIVLKTAGKTTKQLEQELAQALGSNANFSLSPLYPNFVEFKSRNYKAFDGGEVQLPRLNANSITIDINDSGLGVLTKFRFPDVHKAESDSDNLPYLIAFLVVAGLGYFLYTRKNKKRA